MLDKVFVCAVLCLAFGQDCFAEPAYIPGHQVSLKSPAVIVLTESEDKISECRTNLLRVQSAVMDIFISIVSLATETTAALLDTYQCVYQPLRLPKCLFKMISDTLIGYYGAYAKFTHSVNLFAIAIISSAITCVVPSGLHS